MALSVRDSISIRLESFSGISGDIELRFASTAAGEGGEAVLWNVRWTESLQVLSLEPLSPVPGASHILYLFTPIEPHSLTHSITCLTLKF